MLSMGYAPIKIAHNRDLSAQDDINSFYEDFARFNRA
jgi:hypothetical protein